VIEQTFAELIDGPLAHLPSGRFPANAAWLTCAGITHNLLRAARRSRRPTACQAPRRHDPPTTDHGARPHRPTRAHRLFLPAHWPWADAWTALFTATHMTVLRDLDGDAERPARPTRTTT
jgi:hypothetical protein